MNKKCSKCGVEKKLSDFRNRNEYKTGLHVMSWCRVCHNNLCIEYRKKNIEKMRKWQNEYYKVRKVKDRKKLFARYQVLKALRTNKIQKSPCEVCKVVKVQAHHEDYSKPLEIKWLCKKHHFEKHQVHHLQ